ncbi:MAG: hypothetical protein GTO49_14580 [Anaerolineae bacterium]|nr:hypothetical protein [Anaerolineae bacterium]
MIPLTLQEVQIIIGSAAFLLGCLCVILGITVLVTRGYSREVRALAAHTARLSQKGIAQDVTGLVNSASELIAALNDLVRTASGIGVFLVMLGLVMLIGSYWIVLQIDWTFV